jgi:hypothetical protein
MSNKIGAIVVLIFVGLFAAYVPLCVHQETHRFRYDSLHS